MNATWKKAIRDVWAERTRTSLVILAIALGIAGFSTIMSTYAILLRELDRGYLATNPASAKILVDRVDDDLIKTVLSNRAISDAEPRRVVRGRLKAGPMEWRNLTLFVVNDYADIRVSTLKPQRGAWPPKRGDILIERDAMRVARATIGDRVTVKTGDGVETTLAVTGTVHDVGQAQARMENIVYGYITLDTLEQLGEERYLNELMVLVADDQFDERHIRNVVADVQRILAKNGHTIRRIDIPTPGKHPHADLMGLLLLVKASFGLFVLLLSGVLVVNLLTAVMASQVRQIGVMKALGATRAAIARIYLGQALALGVVALAIAIPLGMWGTRLFCNSMAIFLNFDIDNFDVPMWVYALVVAVGLIVPLLAAAYPVWRGSGVAVREALSEFGTGNRSFGNGAIDRFVANIGGTTRPLLLAIRNSFRRRARVILTIVTLALGGVFFMAALNVRTSLINTLDRLFSSRKHDITVTLRDTYPAEKVDRAVTQTHGIAAHEGWITTQASLASANRQVAQPDHRGSGPHSARIVQDHFTVFAIPANSKMIDIEITQGRGLRPEDTNAIVVNNALLNAFPSIEVGKTVALRLGHRPSNFLVVGMTREAFSPATAYIPKTYLERMGDLPPTTNHLRIAIAAEGRVARNQVKEDLEGNLELAGIRATSSNSKAESRYGFDQHMVMIYVTLIVMSAIIGGVGTLGLMTTMSLNVLERRREMGVLRAIGSTPATVWLIIVAEGIVIGGISWLIALLAAWPLSDAVGNLLVKMMFRSGLDFRFDPAGPVVWFAASMLSGILASLIPAWHASREEVREALAYE